MNPVIQKAISIVGSQAELAKRVGVGQSTVSKWLNGAIIGSNYITSISSATESQVSETEILQSIAKAEKDTVA